MFKIKRLFLYVIAVRAEEDTSLVGSPEVGILRQTRDSEARKRGSTSKKRRKKSKKRGLKKKKKRTLKRKSTNPRKGRKSGKGLGKKRRTSRSKSNGGKRRSKKKGGKKRSKKRGGKRRNKKRGGRRSERKLSSRNSSETANATGCQNEAVTYTKQLGRIVVNFDRQKNRADKHAALMAKKNDVNKTSKFTDVAKLLLKAGGGNKTSLKCGGEVGSAGAKVLLNLTNILNNLTVLLQVCSDISSASLKQIQPWIENIANFNKLSLKKVLQF